ncbi:ABC transporter substrate-binding protein [uncultured Cetobacterium sp.]|uniref:ABC transporter substrate-binding protein n=1 Tax=uncultured Cetobacterium sp. TaxID=527638 RepID=UPI0026151118|nr:helical backbone metal receptor [uncultured Cetobacterium sp.]
MYKILGLFFYLFSLSFSETVVDGLGREIEIPLKVERIVSTVPSNTELIIDMGLIDKIVGVDIYSEKISQELKGLGVLNTNALNEEKIIELAPDLVIASSHNLSKGVDSLKIFEELEIPVFVVHTSVNLEDVCNSIDQMGKLLSEPGKAKVLKKRYTEKLDSIKNMTSKIKKRRRVYFEIMPEPIYTTGGKTFINSMIEVAGGRNIFSEEGGWITPSLEKLIEKNPEIIFIGEDKKELVEDIKTRVEWQDIDAVKNNRIYVVDEGINRPSTRVLIALEQMQKLLEER